MRKLALAALLACLMASPVQAKEPIARIVKFNTDTVTLYRTDGKQFVSDRSVSSGSLSGRELLVMSENDQGLLEVNSGGETFWVDLLDVETDSPRSSQSGCQIVTSYDVNTRDLSSQGLGNTCGDTQ